jgi:hypothetical protein
MGQSQSNDTISGKPDSSKELTQELDKTKLKCYLTAIPSHTFEFVAEDGSKTDCCKTCGEDRVIFQLGLQSKLMDPKLFAHVHIWDENDKCIGSKHKSYGDKSIPRCDLDRGETKLNYEVYVGKEKTITEYTPVSAPMWKKESTSWF